MPGSQQAARRRSRRRRPAPNEAGETQAPRGEDSLKFAVIGDSGTGGRAQVQRRRAARRRRCRSSRSSSVLMLGDNIYGSERPQDFVAEVRAAVQAAARRGRASSTPSLGNHDDPNQRFYKPFNMNGKRFYTFKPRRASASSRSTATTWTRTSSTGWSSELAGVARATGRSRSSIIRSTRPAARTAPSSTCASMLEPLFVKHGVERRVRRATSTSTSASSRRRASTTSPAAAPRSCGPATSGRPDLTAKGFDTDYSLHAGRDRRRADALPDSSRGAASWSTPAPSLPRPSTRRPNQEARSHDRMRARAEFVARRGVHGVDGGRAGSQRLRMRHRPAEAGPGLDRGALGGSRRPGQRAMPSTDRAGRRRCPPPPPSSRSPASTTPDSVAATP